MLYDMEVRSILWEFLHKICEKEKGIGKKERQKERKKARKKRNERNIKRKEKKERKERKEKRK